MPDVLAGSIASRAEALRRSSRAVPNVDSTFMLSGSSDQPEIGDRFYPWGPAIRELVQLVETDRAS